jgi:hypothetical protein
VEEDGSRRQEVVYVSPIFDSSTKQWEILGALDQCLLS